MVRVGLSALLVLFLVLLTAFVGADEEKAKPGSVEEQFLRACARNIRRPSRAWLAMTRRSTRSRLRTLRGSSPSR